VDREALMATTMYVYPNTAELKLDELAPPGTYEQLVTFLQRSKPILDEVEPLSRRTPEPFPPMPTLSEVEKDSDSVMRHPRAWFQNFARMLSADAARLAQEGNASAAATRLAACLRLGTAMSHDPDEVQAMTGAGIVGQGAARAVALLDA